MDANIILNLANQVQSLGAGNGHISMNNIKHTKGLTAVISVYDNIKPAHIVLEELYEWADNNNEEVKKLIEKLESDMSWNEENPV